MRASVGEVISHVLNRANGRLPIFEKPGDYEAFERILAEGHERFTTRILAYCVMPNHWHLVLWPRRDGELSAFMAWVTLTHTQRWMPTTAQPGRDISTRDALNPFQFSAMSMS